MRVELGGGSEGERCPHHAVLRAYGSDGSRGESGTVMLGGVDTGTGAGATATREQDVVSWRRGEGGRVERVVSHIRQVQFASGHINVGAAGG